MNYLRIFRAFAFSAAYLAAACSICPNLDDGHKLVIFTGSWFLFCAIAFDGSK